MRTILTFCSGIFLICICSLNANGGQRPDNALRPGSSPQPDNNLQSDSVPRPNILWVTIEDTSPQFIGCYGNQVARTPVIDRLAEEGVRFSNAFSTGTVCSPSRTAIITGVKTYCSGTGHHRSKFPVPEYIKGFPYYLQQSGYYTTNNAKTDYNIGNDSAFIKTAWDESSQRAGWWGRRPGQPFFAVFNFNTSHQSRTMTEPYAEYEKKVLSHLDREEIIADTAFEMPPFYKDSPAMRKQMARVYNSIALTDKQIGELLERLKADNLLDSTIIIFYGDHGEGIPRAKTNGISQGFRVPFIVWFPEMYRHLSPWGTGVVSDELVDFTDLAPSMISLAGGTIPGHMGGRAIMGTERGAPPEYLVLSSDRSDNGIDMVRAVTDGRYFYARNFMPYMPELRYIRYMEIGEIKQIMRADLRKGLLDGLQKGLFEARPAEFLFDTRTDPWETTDLHNQRRYQSLLLRMRSRMEAELLDRKDIMLLPESELAAISKHTTAYEYRLSEERYPVRAIYEAASLAGFRGREVLRKQLDLLDDPNKITRYWAAIGLRSQPESLLRRYADRIAKAVADPYPPVAITAAAVMYELGQDERSKEYLIDQMLTGNEYLALMSVNYALYSDHKEPFAKAVRACYEVRGRTYEVKAACMDFLGSLQLVPNDWEHRE